MVKRKLGYALLGLLAATAVVSAQSTHDSHTAQPPAQGQIARPSNPALLSDHTARMMQMMREMMPMMDEMMTSHHPAQALPAAASPSTKAFKEANDRMHRDMAITFSGNADADFVRSMIPHHEGAVAMAKVALEFGKNEQTRKWAVEIIREQEREIGEMKAWLQKNAP
jgi:hypothetical protein